MVQSTWINQPRTRDDVIEKSRMARPDLQRILDTAFAESERGECYLRRVWANTDSSSSHGHSGKRSTAVKNGELMPQIAIRQATN